MSEATAVWKTEYSACSMYMLPASGKIIALGDGLAETIKVLGLHWETGTPW
jgi:hypothetical protein